MASTFFSLFGNVANVTTTVHTTTAGVKTIYFTSTITNKDNTNLQDHFFNMTVTRGGNTYYRYRNVPVPYGSSFDLGKMVFHPGDIVNLWCDTAGVMDYGFDYVEMS